MKKCNSARSKHAESIPNENIPSISIITVVLNDENNIGRTIDSVISQKYDNKEYIVIDGVSTDNTVKVIASYSERIDKFISENDSGIYDAMNKGIQNSSGKYVIFLNSGDTFTTNNVLQNIADIIYENNNPDVVYGRANLYSQNSKYLKIFSPLTFKRHNLLLYGTRTICHQALFIKKGIAPEYNTKYRLKAELAWYFDILINHPKSSFIKTNEIIANYYLGGIGDASFFENNLERLKVAIHYNGILASLLVFPSIVVYSLYRIKRWVYNLRKNNNYLI